MLDLSQALLEAGLLRVTDPTSNKRARRARTFAPGGTHNAETALSRCIAWVILWLMKLRFDLVEKITPEMLMESVLANHHRYKAEPLLSKTGTGSLSPASTEDRAIEEKLSTDITRKLMSESANDGKNTGPKS